MTSLGSTYACASNCTINNGWTGCSTTLNVITTGCTTTCGDGYYVSSAESCDNGNLTANSTTISAESGCSTDCKV